MIDERERFERTFQQFQMPEPAWDRLVGRRDRKRRNRRITAGVVGIAVFVAAVWIVRDVALLDRSEKSVIPGGSSTTGPAETGPIFDPSADYWGLPPAGAEPSGPPGRDADRLGPRDPRRVDVRVRRRASDLVVGGEPWISGAIRLPGAAPHARGS
jgi:hypothetical protein